MAIQDFIDLCKDQIRSLIDSEEDYVIYTIWKDFWTIGASNDSIKDLNNQRAIFGTTINDTYYDISYNGYEHELHINTYVKSGSTHTISINNSDQSE